MDFNFTPEQQLFRQSVREFADRYVRPRINEMEDEKDIPKELLDRIADQGFYGLRFAEEWGGQGGDNVMFAILNEELARCHMSVAARVMMQCLIVIVPSSCTLRPLPLLFPEITQRSSVKYPPAM